MSEIPGARVVRGGDGLVLRLAPRALPRALVWRLWFGGTIATVGWIFTVVGLALSIASQCRWSI